MKTRSARGSRLTGAGRAVAQVVEDQRQRRSDGFGGESRQYQLAVGTVGRQREEPAGPAVAGGIGLGQPGRYDAPGGTLVVHDVVGPAVPCPHQGGQRMPQESFAGHHVVDKVEGLGQTQRDSGYQGADAHRVSVGPAHGDQAGGHLRPLPVVGQDEAEPGAGVVSGVLGAVHAVQILGQLGEGGQLRLRGHCGVGRGVPGEG